jgi:hypothetical protein
MRNDGGLCSPASFPGFCRFPYYLWKQLMRPKKKKNRNQVGYVSCTPHIIRLADLLEQSMCRRSGAVVTEGKVYRIKIWYFEFGLEASLKK